jgi:hypothetical protein
MVGQKKAVIIITLLTDLSLTVVSAIGGTFICGGQGGSLRVFVLLLGHAFSVHVCLFFLSVGSANPRLLRG